MAKMVTRTFITTHATIIGINSNDDIDIRTVDLIGKLDDKKVLKTVEIEGFTAVKVKEITYSEEVRGVNEVDFYNISVPVTRPESQRK